MSVRAISGSIQAAYAGASLPGRRNLALDIFRHAVYDEDRESIKQTEETES